MKCGSCGSADVRRCHRRGLHETVLFRMIFLAPYRCGDCCRRFVSWYFGPNRQTGSYAGPGSVLRFWVGMLAMWLAAALLILAISERLAHGQRRWHPQIHDTTAGLRSAGYVQDGVGFL